LIFLRTVYEPLLKLFLFRKKSEKKAAKIVRKSSLRTHNGFAAAPPPFGTYTFSVPALRTLLVLSFFPFFLLKNAFWGTGVKEE
jgi:hypothetical protein